MDGSSGALGSAVNQAIADLVPIIAKAPADAATREVWLERLYAAHEADQMPYIESLADYWAELCASREVASAWADRLLDATRLALSPDRRGHRFFHGTSACLSALYGAGRFDELIEILQVRSIWAYKSRAVRALVAKGEKAEALRLAGSCRGPGASDPQIDSACEEILLSSGLLDEAYARYGLRANQRATYLATFRAVSVKYPHKPPSQILADLVETTPGQEGKWFAAAKDAGLYDEALALAGRSPCDPKTLARAARDYADKRPAFAVEAGLLGLQWLTQGYGYEIEAADVRAAYGSTLAAAERQGRVAEVKGRVSEMTAAGGAGARFVAAALAGELRS